MRAVLPAAALLCLAAPSHASQRALPEAGSYSMDAFAVRSGAHRLPPELVAPAVAHAMPEAGAGGAVELAWKADERFGFRGYLLTATIESGPLSGLATQWNVAPASGEREGPDGAYAYRVRLDLPAFSASHVRAALEGVRADGSRVLLAVREVRARPRPQPRGTSFSRNNRSDGGVASSTAGSRAPLALSHASTAISALPAAPSDQPNADRLHAGGSQVPRVRGPPATAA